MIPVYEAGESDGRLFIAMRWVEGTDLRSVIAHEGTLDPERVVRDRRAGRRRRSTPRTGAGSCTAT